MSYIEAKRDVKIEGNVNINNTYKLLNQCDNEELIIEEKHRKKLLKKEETKKRKNIKSIAIASLLVGVIIFIYCFFFNGVELKLSAYAGIASPFIAIFFSVMEMSKPSEFEIRQQIALEEITMLLREREVR